MTILLTIIGYFLLLMGYSRWATGRNADNEAFFLGNRQSPWYMVAFGMVGASISGITFVSVPGMVVGSNMSYVQTCLGFILGYFIVAKVLLPVYYRLNLTTIYSFLNDRLGRGAYKTGATFFLLSKMTGAAARFYVVCIVIEEFVLRPLWPAVYAEGGGTMLFCLATIAMVCLIWLYTRSGGIKTLVWTDVLQTSCMIIVLAIIIYKVIGALDMSLPEAWDAIWANEHSRMFVFDDAVSRQYFWKQFLSGIFIVIVMTGLDQDMMQKNLTCKSLKDAQKDMCTYGLAFVPVNILFMCLGILLLLLVEKEGMLMPQSTDTLLSMFAASGWLGTPVVIMFVIGIMAAAFSSADSALTAITTCYCVDICERRSDEKLRKMVHIGAACVFCVCIVMFRMLNSTSLIDAIYVMCSYTYGPLLGLFAFAAASPLLMKKAHKPGIFATGAVCIAAPVICYALDNVCLTLWNYRFGYELLMINGALTFLGLTAISQRFRQ